MGRGHVEAERVFAQDWLWSCRGKRGFLRESSGPGTLPASLRDKAIAGELEGVPRVPACRASLWGGGGGTAATPSWPAPTHAPPLSQVSCPYVGCGESFADHSTIHAQVSGGRGRGSWSEGPELKAQPQPPPSSPCPHWAPEAVSIKWERS